MKNQMKLGLCLLALVVMTTGCVTTRQARSTTASAFLGSAASLLQPGKDGQVLLRYVNPDADWKKYDKIMLSPVTYWTDADNDDGLKYQDRKALVDYLYAQLREKFGKSYTLVDVAGPNTLLLSAALINAKHSYPVISSVSVLMPIGLGLNIVKTAVTGKPSFVGEVRGEAKITDAMTGELLAAGSDKRVGGMGWKDKYNEWGAVENSCQYWAELIVSRFCGLQGRSNCPKPSDYE